MGRTKGARAASYKEKRRALLQRMTARLLPPEAARPSLRQLAEAAGVSTPTLRHYFGDRAQVICAILDNYLREGLPQLEAFAAPSGGLEPSVREFAVSLLLAWRAPQSPRLGDVFAVSLAEGLLDPAIAPAALGCVIDPLVDALSQRLAEHVRRGEMIASDERAAALFLLSPLLVAALHQDQMGGALCNPADLDALTGGLVEAFVHAYRRR